MLLVIDDGLVTLKLISLRVCRPSSFPWAAVINLHGEAPGETQNLFITFAQSVLTVTSSQACIHISIGLYLGSIVNSVRRCIVKKMDGREENGSYETWRPVNSTLLRPPWCVWSAARLGYYPAFLESRGCLWMATSACMKTHAEAGLT